MLKDLSFLIKKLYNPYNSFLSQASGLLNIVIRFYRITSSQTRTFRDKSIVNSI